MKPIIEVENLSKKYRLGEIQPYYSLRDDIANLFRNPFSKNNELEKQEFWALKDVSFKVDQGEVLGVIGPNGAGKSTLLKVLSRITPPSSGKAILRGRVASLLEVGTGFNPELTGRENIYLNGAILGMTRREIRKKFNEIVDFSGVEQFLDTPVKRYSSGMYVRLAFAVAAHLESEILLIDEVLSVGDAEFQKKCLGKMESITKKQGRTIVFISHNINSVKSLCYKVILLENGIIIKIGNPKEVTDYYLFGVNKASKVLLSDRKDRRGNGKIKLINIKLSNDENKIEQFVSGKTCYVDVEIENKENILKNDIEVAIAINKIDGTRLLYMGTKIFNMKITLKPLSNVKLRCIIPDLPLEPDNYYISAEIMEAGSLEDYINDAVLVAVKNGDYYGTGKIWPFSGILSKYTWQIS